MFDLEEEALDEIALAIEGVVARYLRRCFPRRDDWNSVLGTDSLAQSFGIVALVAKNVFRRDVGDEGFGLGMVARLPWSQDEAQRIAEGIDDGMDLGGQSAARAADRTSFRPPFLPAAC